MPDVVTRHFVTVDGRWGPRQVHYRRAGEGPAVLLLHQSPQSSRDLIPVLRAWSAHFTLVAPDMPGYGQSDPLAPATAAIPIEDFAAATLEFADAVGLRRLGVYGFHTGASIGVALAARHRERVAALAAHGLAQLTGEERDDICAHYLPACVPSWDGAHLAWLWARLREQTIFFPWYRQSAAARMDLDVPAPEDLQQALLDFMRSGAHYAVAYRAAFEFEPAAVLPGLEVPLIVTAAAGDPLQSHLARLRDLPHGAEVTPASTHAEALERALHHLLAHRGDPAPAPVATRAIPGRLWRRMVRTAEGTSSVLASLTGAGEPLLFLHDAGASSATAAGIAAPLVGVRPVVVPDLPGHGESPWAGRPAGPTVRDCTAAVHAVINDLGLSRIALAGQGAGACVALEIARRPPHEGAWLALIDLPRLPSALAATIRARGLPTLAPQWHGGHLLEAWHMLHDTRLFFPWFQRTRAAALRIEPDLDPVRLHAELLELLKAEGAWQSLASDALGYAASAALRAVSAALLAAIPGSGWEGPAREAASLGPALRFVSLPAEPSRWLPELFHASP